jgi:predicted transcriptional regulator
MPDPKFYDLSKRERQIMDVVFRKQSATVSDVLEDLPNPPSYSAVRALMRILEEKGYLRHHKDAARYVYTPVTKPQKAMSAALKLLLKTYCNNSVETAVAAIIDIEGSRLTDEEYDRLLLLIQKSKGR